MASCKDCFFNGVCRHNWQDWELKSRGIENRMDEACKDFKDKSLFVELPCKVGDTVYTNLAVSGWYLRTKDKPYPVKVVFIGINNSVTMGGGFMNVEYKNGNQYTFDFDKIGKTVFLTRAEAEKALKGA